MGVVEYAEKELLHVLSVGEFQPEVGGIGWQAGQLGCVLVSEVDFLEVDLGDVVGELFVQLCRCGVDVTDLVLEGFVDG